MARLDLFVRVITEGANKLDKLTGKLGTVGRNLTVGVTAPLIAAGAAAFKFASDVEEATSKAKTVFDTASDDMIKSSKDLDDAWSQAQFLDLAGTFGAILQQMEFTEKEAADLSKEWLSLSQDMASFHNTDPVQAIEAIQSALAGEFEPLKQYGVLLNATTVQQKAMEMGLWDGVGVLDAHTRALVIQSELMRQQPDVIGDYARTAEGAANSGRNLVANFQDAAAVLGEQLLPAGTALLQMVSGWLQSFQELDPATRGLIVQVAVLAAVIGPLLLLLSALIGAFGAVAGAFSGLSLLLLANPFVALIAAIVALVAIVVLNWDAIVLRFQHAMQEISDTMAAIGDAIGAAWDAIIGVFDEAAKGIQGIGKRIFTPISKGFEAAIGAIRGIWNAFVRFWNGIQISVPAVNIPVVGRVGGFTIGLPDLPFLAAGGIINDPTLAVLGEKGPEAVIPLDQMPEGGITFNFNGPITGDQRELPGLMLRTLYVAQVG